jgi:hypothetical protein
MEPHRSELILRMRCIKDRKCFVSDVETTLELERESDHEPHS